MVSKMPQKDEDRFEADWNLTEETDENDKEEVKVEWKDLAEESEGGEVDFEVDLSDGEKRRSGSVLLHGTSKVTDKYYEAVEECLETVIDELDAPLEIVDGRNKNRRLYRMSPMEMRDKAVKNNQVDGKELNDILMKGVPEDIPNNKLGVFVTGKDMNLYDEKKGSFVYDFIFGATQRFGATSVSTRRFERRENKNIDMKEVFKTMVYHELGHLFGATDEFKRDDLVERYGKHCANKDVVRQGVNISEFIKYTEDRLKSGQIYCDSCKEAMEEYISQI